METILALHVADDDVTAMADTVDTMLRLFDLPPARATELRALTELRLRTEAETLPDDDPTRAALLNRADAYDAAQKQADAKRRSDTVEVAEAVYWIYHSQREQGDVQAAYEMTQYLTTTYPESDMAQRFMSIRHRWSHDYSAIEERLRRGDDAAATDSPAQEPAP